MTQDTRTKFIFIVILTALLAYIVAPIPNKPTLPLLKDAKINLGIDLAGGAELTYRVLYAPGESNKEEKTRMATDVLRRRIEQKQLKEPKITHRGEDQIVIQLAGVDRAALEDYKKLIETAGQLELYATAPKDVQEKFNRDQVVTQGYRVWKNEHKMSDSKYAHLSTDKILLKDRPIIEGKDIATAGHSQRWDIQGMQWVVSFELKADGAKLFDEAAARLFNENPRGLIAIVLDGVIISNPIVNAPEFGGHGIITGNFDEPGARNLAIILRSGSLPAPIGRLGPNGEAIPRQAESEVFVGPSLGQDSIRRGLLASGLTLALVAVFMITYYRKSGLIAVITLALNLVYLLGIMAFFGATLTLPGLAGIVLTVGMAVDANILIMERIREEQAKGKTASQSFEAGHDRAWSAIIDSNVTTVLAAVVLYYFGTGPVQGFAVTLTIGILTTLFSVLVCGKVFLKMLIAGGLTEFTMLKLMTQPNLDYLKSARRWVVTSALLVAAGTTLFFSRGEKNFGIDFRGGSMLTFGFGEPQNIDEVRKRIQGFAPQGQAKYADAEVQTVATEATVGLGGSVSRSFQVRTRFPSVVDLKNDIQDMFKDSLSHEPFQDMPASDVDANPRFIADGPGGPGWYVYAREEKADLAKIRAKLVEGFKNPPREIDFRLERDEKGDPAFAIEEVPGAPKGLKKLKLTLAKKDAEAQAGDVRRRVREVMKNALRDELSQDPFAAQGNLGPAVAKELQNSTIWALIISWALMIVYIAIRFASWRYGAAAVVALIHDALLAIGFVSFAGAVVPSSWGLSFEMNLTTMAAILTIIGYAINDKIVVFDRIRENLVLMKKNTFAEIINASVNQTMSRTILTGMMLWVACIILYVLTMNTGGGIAEFAFPLIIGIVAGTYSTIYIACPIVLWWYAGQKPPTA